MVKYPFDLRTSVDEKREIARNSPTWVAFLNNAGTICHLIHPDENWIIRLACKPSLKNCSLNYIERVLTQRVQNRIIL